MKLFRALAGAIRFTSLPPESRRLTFYSEGGNYWVHLEGIVRALLEHDDVSVNYISSSPGDPGLALTHPRFRAFETDEGAIRNWLFENLQTDVMVMTMPDLHQYQVKRSRHQVHYVYVQHSLVSLHMIYRPGAFDHFDTIFCAGPHHVAEVRAMEALAGLPEKQVVEHGYGRLDAIRAAAPGKEAPASEDVHVLIAPSWGPQGLIEAGLADSLVAQLLKQGHRVTLRPHPQTTRLAPQTVRRIVDAHRHEPRFVFEDNVASQRSLHDSHIMISDWSGAALDYAFGLGKPVVFVDVPRKVNNPAYEAVGITPFEVTIREQVGVVVQPDQLAGLDIEAVLETRGDFEVSDAVFNVGTSADAGASHLRSMVV